MKLLMRKIDCCADCPHHKSDYWSGFDYCSIIFPKSNDSKFLADIDDVGKIHPNCPLPDCENKNGEKQ